MAFCAASDNPKCSDIVGLSVDLIFQFGRSLCFLEGGICCSSSGAPNLIARIASDKNALCLAQGAGLVFVAVYKRDRQRCRSPMFTITRASNDTLKRALRECELRAEQLKRPLETKPSVAPSEKVRCPWALPARSLVAFLGGSLNFSQLLLRRMKETWRAGFKSFFLFRVCQSGCKVVGLSRFAGRGAQKWLHAHLWSCTNRSKRKR